MLRQHAAHVYSLSDSPHRSLAISPHRRLSHSIHSATKQAFHNMPSSAPVYPNTTATTAVSPSSSYNQQDWSLLCISRPLINTPTGTSRSTLTVTLLYHPAQTLYAWPFDLSGSDSKGTCYVTPFVSHPGADPVQPPPEALSVSLRVLADVVRTWIGQGHAKSASFRRNSNDTYKGPASPLHQIPGSVSPTLSQAESDFGIVESINTALGLATVDNAARSVHLARQRLPYSNPNVRFQWHQRSNSLDSGADLLGARVRTTSAGDRRHRSNDSEASIATSDSICSVQDSPPSSEASTPRSVVEPPLDPLDKAEDLPLIPSPEAKSTPKTARLPKIDTRIAALSVQFQAVQPQLCDGGINDNDDEDSTPKASGTTETIQRLSSQANVGESPPSVPKILLVEPTPQTSAYVEREKVLLGTGGEAEGTATRPPLAKGNATMNSLLEPDREEDGDEIRNKDDANDHQPAERSTKAVVPHRKPTLPDGAEGQKKTKVGAFGNAMRVKGNGAEPKPGRSLTKSAFATLAASASVAAIAVANVEPERRRTDLNVGDQNGADDEQPSADPRSAATPPRPLAAKIPLLLKKSSMELKSKFILATGGKK
ncbi:hypothetical protein ACQY0O_004323 [Thecaphora frezii]